MDGEFTDYNQNGKINRKGTYKNGKIEGKVTFYNENGLIKSD